MRYFIYGNGGGIDKVKRDLENPEETFSSLLEVFNILKERFSIPDIHCLSLEHYCCDPRIDKEVYVVLTKNFDYTNCLEKYGCPQFVSYLVEIE